VIHCYRFLRKTSYIYTLEGSEGDPLLSLLKDNIIYIYIYIYIYILGGSDGNLWGEMFRGNMLHPSSWSAQKIEAVYCTETFVYPHTRTHDLIDRT